MGSASRSTATSSPARSTSLCASVRSSPNASSASSTRWCASWRVRARPTSRAKRLAGWSWRRWQASIRWPISASPRSTGIFAKPRISGILSDGSPRMAIDGAERGRGLGTMQAALSLARRGLGTVWPNPAVGCVIVNKDRVVGRGWTQPGGRPHGETEALRRAGDAARGATAYVSLEPCCHWGHTPPCADALADAGVRRVVVAIEDPDPRVAGAGLQRLRGADIEVETGLGAEAAAEINAGFFTRLRLGRPLVTLKLATSLDGHIATASGESRWITGPPARERAHAMRADHDAIMVGTGTVLADDPQLTCRLPGLDHRSPVRVVIDRHLRVPPTSQVIAQARQVPTWLITLRTSDPRKREV